MEIQGKKALVFGGTSGIGLAAANQLAAKGAKVVALSRDPSKAGAPGPNVTFKSCDVRDALALEALFAAEGPFDILVSAATGGARAAGPFLDMDMDTYQASFAKLWGYTNVVRYGTRHLAENGAIVLVSGAPARRARDGQIALASVGGAVEAFARTVSKEIKPRRINVVSPGIIATAMFGADDADRADRLANMTKNNLIPRAGTPDEAASAIIFLIENDFVTGTTVDVDGGWLLS